VREHRTAVNHCSISTIEPHGLSLIIQANAGSPTAQLNRAPVPSFVELETSMVSTKENARQPANQPHHINFSRIISTFYKKLVGIRDT